METTKVTPLAVLERLVAQAKAGELAHVVVVTEATNGDTGLHASSMGMVQANHLWRVFDDRVAAMYRDVRLRAAKAARAPTAGAGVPANGPKAAAAAAIPREVRRATGKALRKAAKKAARAARAAAPEPKPAPPGAH